MRVKSLKITEAEFTRQVLEYAKLKGWRTAHFRPARTKDGWRTAVSGDGKGFPDLLMVRQGRMIVAELKVGKNKVSEAQKAWLNAFVTIVRLWTGAMMRVDIWTPDDWPEIERMLS